MSLNTRRALAPAALVCLSLTCLTGASEAFTLQRIAASVDFGGVAAATHRPSAANAGAPGVVASLSVPAAIELLAPITEIRIGIPCECDVTIEVADESGAPLFLAQAHMPAGWQKVGFSGRDVQGNMLANGVYYYTVTADGYSQTSRVTINR